VRDDCAARPTGDTEVQELEKAEAVGWYSVIKTIKGHRYEYLQRTWREGKKVRTESVYIGPAEVAQGSAPGRPPRESDFDGTFSRGDVVRATNKITGEVRIRIYACETPTGFGLADRISGIPYKYKSSEWSLELLRKAPPLGLLQYKVGDTFVYLPDGEVMTITKVLEDKGKYILESISGSSDATVTEELLLQHFKPSSRGRTSTTSHDSRPPRASDLDGVITTPSVFYHGSPSKLEGAIEPSDEGTFGPGLYLTTHARATLYAQYDAWIAARIAEGEGGWRIEPQYDGTVYGFDVSGLRLSTLKHGRYQELCMALDPQGALTPSAKAKLQEHLAEAGYDGLYILDEVRHELVVFPASLHKVKILDR
jgi:hypothetical protein